MIRFILRKFGLHTIITLGLLLAAVNCLNAGLGTIIRGATMSAFLPVGTAAALLGWGLASGRFKGWLAWGAIIVLGVLLLTGTTAQLGVPLLELGKLLPSILYQQFLWAREHIPPDFSAAASAWAVVAAQYIGLWERVAHWTQGVLSGVNIYDPVVRVLIWSLLLWPMAAWMGWFLRRRQALIGMAPALVLLALVGDYTRAETWPLWGLLSITLLLMGLTRYETNMARWASRSMDYAEIIQGDTTLAIVLVTTALALAAWVVPSISIRSITDALRERQDGSSNQTVAKALGLEQPPSEPGHFAPYRSPGLPNQHLIGAGPELARIPVMSISTGELPPGPTDQLARVAPHHHWRSNTFDRYTGSGWASSAVESESYGANVPVFEQSPQGYRVLHQDVIKENTTDGKLYWDGTVLYSADHTFEAGWRIRPAPGSSQSTDPLGGADLLGALSDAKTYQIESLLPTFSVEQLRAAPAVYPDDIVGRYLELPKTVPERVLALARDLTATSPTPYDRAKAIETYLRSTYPYTLDIPAPPAGRDVVDYFLFDLKKGYCDYYATSMVVLARAAGLPARIVIGYATGTYDPYSAVYNITQADAHAWVEVYFSGLGWVEFEPTANQPGIIRPSTGGRSGDTGTLAGQEGDSGNLNAVLRRIPGFARWSIFAVFGLALLIAVLQLVEHWLLTRISTTRAVQWIYQSIYRLGRKLSGPSSVGETTSEFAAILEGRLEELYQHGYLRKPFAPATAELDLLTNLYLRAVYTTHTPQKDEVLQALRAWRGLRWRLLLARVMPIANRKS